MSSSVLDLKRLPAGGPQPDRSPAAIARRREANRQAIASNALDGCHRTADSDHIYERWILGEITDEECVAMIGEYLQSRRFAPS